MDPVLLTALGVLLLVIIVFTIVLIKSTKTTRRQIIENQPAELINNARFVGLLQDGRKVFYTCVTSAEETVSRRHHLYYVENSATVTTNHEDTKVGRGGVSTTDEMVETTIVS